MDDPRDPIPPRDPLPPRDRQITDVQISNVKTASGINIIAGIWLIIAPFVIGYQGLEAAVWNDIICGAIVLILAAIRVSTPLRNPWLSWVILLVGLWLIISSFVQGYAEFPSPVWNNIILGIIVAILGAWSAWSTGPARPTYTA